MYTVIHRALAAAAAGALTAGLALGAGNSYAEPAPALLSADQLTRRLAVIFDTNAGAAERAAYLEGGQAALPTADEIGGPIAQHRSMVSLRVENPALEGNHLTSQLVMSVIGMGSRRRTLDWVESGGAWKLSNGSLCALFDETAKGNGCTL
ncbi:MULTISPECIES: hypothetical protein [unclassified Mycobacterium]|uniref:hypothetical protein n=1 Tax=unclassified Mycobacterium TaxID=2642494 RepID=UPI000993AF1A|nr:MULTISPECIES: hypothetical protein [unclassified Mycobacterium]